MKPALIDNLDPRERISESFPDNFEIESCVVANEVSLRMCVDEGLEILRLYESMKPSV